MDGNMRFYSHPGKELKTHLKTVASIMIETYKDKEISFKSTVHEHDIIKIALFHDFGKYTTYFQDYLLRKKKDNRNLHFHSFISALLSAWITSNKSNYMSLISYFTIKHHHTNLTNLKINFQKEIESLNILEKQLQNIKTLSNYIETEYNKDNNININIKSFTDSYKATLKLLENRSFFLLENEPEDKKLNLYFIILFIFSLLVYSDKTEVVIGRIEKNALPSNIDTFIDVYKEKTFSNQKPDTLNSLREKAYETAYKSLSKLNANSILSLNLLTGAGKTLTVLNVAFNLCKKDKTLQRVIYALPFTSIIDQTEKVVRDIFKKNGYNPDDFITVHHHLAEAKIKTDENYIEGDKAQLLIENWDKPLILTTFWQLFHSIISNENSQLRKFHNISNSVIILDEVQSIPYKYWHLIEIVLKKLTELFGCKIILMTATMPLIFDKKELYQLIRHDLRNEFFSSFSRYKVFTLNRLKDLTIDELAEIAEEDIKQNHDKNFLFVFNTIDTSVEFYKLLKGRISEREFIYLSSNILPIDRKRRIDDVKHNSEGKVVISTQVVEAGVDIDMDIVYRDFAPLDSIIQTAGRCNRNSKKELGTVKLFKLKNKKDKHDFGYIYKGLPLNVTNELFKDIEEIEESKMLKLIDEYFYKVKENKSNNENKKIISAMEELKYEDVSKEFKLIDEIPSFSMFFEIDDKASDLLDRFCKIIEIENRFERKNELLKIKSQFYQYVLSVKKTISTKSYFENLEEIGGIQIVKKDVVNSIYDKETGLIKKISVFA